MKKNIHFGSILVVLCCLFGISNLFATPAISAGAQYFMQVQPGVSQEMVGDTELAIQTAAAFCTEKFGFSLAHPVAVLIVSGRAEYQAELEKVFKIDEVSAARWARTTDAVSGTNKIIRNGASSNSASDRIFLVAHEMVHQYQRQIGYPAEGAWLVEGMADAIGIHVAEQLGRRSVAEYERRWHVLLTGKTPPSLATLATRAGWAQSLQTNGVQVTYRTAALTVLQLWDDYGFDKVLEFYRLSVRLGTALAFEQVFGSSLSDFQLRLGAVQQAS